MNCSQYSYSQTQSAGHMQNKDMTTRPAQPDNMNMDMGRQTGMPMSMGRMTDMQSAPMSMGRMPGMQAPSMGMSRMRDMQGAAMPDTGRGVSASMTPPPGGWNLPSTTAQLTAQTPTTVESPYYTAGFLRNFIGKTMRVEFLIGTSGALVDRTGELVEVGASYIVLKPSFTDDLIMCDLYAIKFVTIYQ